MGADFSVILQGLMANRRLTRRTLSRASGRAASTINQLLIGRIAPTVQILEDIAPTLRIPLADLLTIAGLAAADRTADSEHRPASQEIGTLVAAASWLTPQQVESVTAYARSLRTD